jgi:hypothetical protein
MTLPHYIKTEIERIENLLKEAGVSIELDTNTEEAIAQRQKLVKDKQQELESFRAMLTVLESSDATKWIIHKIADIIADRSVVENNHTIELIARGVRDRCLERIATLEKELAELAPVTRYS